MDNNSDSDNSYDKISWKEFYIGVSDSDQEESVKDEKLVNNEVDDSVSENLQNEQNNDIGVTFEYFSDNSSDIDDSVGEDSDDSVEVADYENDFRIDLLEIGEHENVAFSSKRNTLVVPGAFGYPSQIKRRENMEIKDLVKDHVLPFLPAKSLARFKAVSKEWNRWISSPLLAHRQSYLFRGLTGFVRQVIGRGPAFVPLDKPSSGVPDPSLCFLPEHVVVRASCFGLLLCQSLRDNDAYYYVCNPANKEYRKIPTPSFYHGHDPAIVLAFEPSEMNMEAHFELICAVPVMDYPIVYFEVYSSESNEWRLSTVECIEVGDSVGFLGGGFYVNKIAYFVTDSGCLVGFDAKSEVCGVFSLPLGCESGGVVARIGGETCYVHVSNEWDENENEIEDENNYDVCVYGGMDMSLKRRISGVFNCLGLGGWRRILPFVTDDGDDLAVLARGMLRIYRMSEEGGKIIGFERDLGAKYFPFVSSLVQLPPGVN